MQFSGVTVHLIAVLTITICHGSSLVESHNPRDNKVLKEGQSHGHMDRDL